MHNPLSNLAKNYLELEQLLLQVIMLQIDMMIEDTPKNKKNKLGISQILSLVS